LNVGEKYHIVVHTKLKDAYYWRNGKDYPSASNDDEFPSMSIDSGANWTVYDNETADGADSIDYTFKILTANPKLDFNKDGYIGSKEISILQNSIGMWNETFWLPLVDFNAVFCLYEEYRDKTLGFDAYIETGPKVQTCAFPALEIGIGNRRCDYKYDEYWNNSLDTEFNARDCPVCNYDGFCSHTEQFINCTDCDFWRLIPQADNFTYPDTGGATTPFWNFTDVSDLESVSPLVLERLPYGRITWQGPINVSSHPDFDEFPESQLQVWLKPRRNHSTYVDTLVFLYPCSYI